MYTLEQQKDFNFTWRMNYSKNKSNMRLTFDMYIATRICFSNLFKKKKVQSISSRMKRNDYQ